MLVIDDGSRDGTADVARACGVASRRPAPAQQGAGRRVHGRHRRVAQAGRRLHRQHRRRQPVRRRSDIPRLLAAAARAARPTSCIGDRNIAELAHMSWRKRQLQRLGSWVVRQVSNTTVPGHDQRLPRLHARSGAAHDDRLGVLLHARVDHPGRQEADGDRARAGRDQPAHARLAAVRQHLLVHQAIGGDDRAHLRDVRAAQGLHLHRRCRCSALGVGGRAALPLLPVLRRPRHRPPPVADPRPRC